MPVYFIVKKNYFIIVIQYKYQKTNKKIDKPCLKNVMHSSIQMTNYETKQWNHLETTWKHLLRRVFLATAACHI